MLVELTAAVALGVCARGLRSGSALGVCARVLRLDCAQTVIGLRSEFRVWYWSLLVFT